MYLRKARNILLAVALGAMPLGTVSTCDYSNGSGMFYYDQGDGMYVGRGHGRSYADEIYVEDVYYEEEIIVEDVYYYDDCYWWDGCYWADWWW